MEENCRSDGDWEDGIVFCCRGSHIWSHPWTEQIKFVNIESIYRTRIHIEDALTPTFGIIQARCPYRYDHHSLQYLTKAWYMGATEAE
jgi:hypothetical protein